MSLSSNLKKKPWPVFLIKLHQLKHFCLLWINWLFQVFFLGGLYHFRPATKTCYLFFHSTVLAWIQLFQPPIFILILNISQSSLSVNSRTVTISVNAWSTLQWVFSLFPLNVLFLSLAKGCVSELKACQSSRIMHFWVYLQFKRNSLMIHLWKG